jgi:hypothetical protein
MVIVETDDQCHVGAESFSVYSLAAAKDSIRLRRITNLTGDHLGLRGFDL